MLGDGCAEQYPGPARLLNDRPKPSLSPTPAIRAWHKPSPPEKGEVKTKPGWVTGDKKAFTN